MRFDDVIGQDKLKENLQRMLAEGRIGHAIMLAGKEGSGNLALGVALASAFLSLNSPDPDASRKKCDKLIHPDLHFCYPVNITKKVVKKPVSAHFLTEWREAVLSNPYMNGFDWLNKLGIVSKQAIINVGQSSEILSNLSLKPYESDFKVMLIWLPEKMNTAAANKLLKILEEPPLGTVFILVSQNPEQLLPTILSRVQTIYVKPISRESIQKVLEEKHGVDSERARFIARISQGNYLEAMRLINENDEEVFNQTSFIKWMRFLWKKEYSELIRWIEAMVKVGREGQKMFLHYALHIMRESLMRAYTSGEFSRTEGKEKQFIEKFYPFVNAANALELIAMFEEAHYHISRNANARILFADISLKMMKLIRKKPESKTLV